MDPSSPDYLADLIEFLAPYPTEIQALTLDAREWLRERYAPVTEIFWDATQAVCSGLTFTDHERDNFLNLAVYPKHVTLIFPWGVRLTDPEGRLRGEGKQVRHIRLAGMQTLHEPAVQALMDQASDAATRPAQPVAPGRIVKVMKGPKRRPA